MNFQDIQKLNRVVLYDGDCGFCNSMVQFILSYRIKEFYFLPLQSPIAEEWLKIEQQDLNLDTLYYFYKGKWYNQSDAALRIAKDLKNGMALLYYFGRLIPRLLRNNLYRKVAKRRQRLMKKHCVLPTAAERKYFL